LYGEGVMDLGTWVVNKIRESFAHTEWPNAYMRWAGGSVNMEEDAVMQQINQLGPKPIFAREVRRNNGRFFVSVMPAFLNLTIMPIAIYFGFSPFEGINLLYWVGGVMFSQVLTLHGLIATMRERGFNRWAAAAGGVFSFATIFYFSH